MYTSQESEYLISRSATAAVLKCRMDWISLWYIVLKEHFDMSASKTDIKITIDLQFSTIRQVLAEIIAQQRILLDAYFLTCQEKKIFVQSRTTLPLIIPVFKHSITEPFTSRDDPSLIFLYSQLMICALHCNVKIYSMHWDDRPMFLTLLQQGYVRQIGTSINVCHIAMYA